MKHLNILFNLFLLPFLFVGHLVTFIFSFSTKNKVNNGDVKRLDSGSTPQGHFLLCGRDSAPSRTMGPREKRLFVSIFFFFSLLTGLNAASDDYTLTMDSPDLSEGAGSATVNIRVTPQNKNTWKTGDHIIIHYETQDAGGGADATAGSDYTAISSTQLTITPNNDGTAVVQIPVTILQDTLSEGDEEFSLVLISASANNGQTVDIGDGGLITIIDDDTGTLPSLSIEDESIDEEAGSVSVRVSLSMVSANPVTFSYATVDVIAASGVATRDSDYTESGETVTIPAGSSYVDIHIPILSDLINEGDEIFEIYLSNPVNATIGDLIGIVTILDNDTGDTLSINNASIAEGDIDKNATIRILLSSPSVNDLHITYHTVEDNATSDVDYVQITSGSATIPAGSSDYNLTVTIKGDDENEEIENFYLILDTVTGTTVPALANLTSTITIFDDDSSGSCSSYVGLMTLNEYQNNPHYFDGPRNDPASKITGNFVEIKYIDFLVKRFVTDDWSVSVYGNAGTQDILWRDRDLDCVDPRYEVFQFDNNVMGARGYVTLKDENGNEVDVLAITTDSSDYYTQQCHDFVYDIDYALSAQNKDLFREPDGTGDWVDHGSGANSGGSRCVNKDGSGGLLFTEFDAIDIDETPNTPIQSGDDVPIKTKVVNRLFSLDILSLEVTDPNTAGNLKNSSVTIKVYLVDETGNRLPNQLAQEVVFTDLTTVRVTDLFIYDRAIKIARVGFEYCGTDTGATGDWDTCYNTGNPDDIIYQRRSQSRNRFAIRPDHFELTPPSGVDLKLLTAGKEYNLTITAPDFLIPNHNTDDYNQSKSDIEINLIRYFADGGVGDNTLVGNLTWSDTPFNMVNGISFYNGANDVAGIKYSDVGDINIQFIDKIWAAVDTDTPQDCNSTSHAWICGEDTNATFIPDHFTLSDVNLSNHRDGNFTYLTYNDDLNMSSHLDINITAMTEDEQITKNFKSGDQYYENPITVTLTIPDTPAPILVKSKHEITPAAKLGFTDGNKHIGWDESNETQKIMFNYNKIINTSHQPFIIDGADVDVNVASIYPATPPNTDANITGDSNADRNATFYYARTRSSKPSYETDTNSIATPIAIDVYCALGYTACENFGIDTVSGQIDDYDWWLSTDHRKSQGDGNVTLIKGSILTGVPGSTWNVAPTIVTIDNSNGIDGNIIVTNTSNNTPLTVGIDLVTDTTLTTYTHPWLLYNKDDPVPFNPFYEVSFIGTSKWVGDGKTGHVIETNATSGTANRIFW